MSRVCVLVILISIAVNAKALLLCDGDCANSSDVDICQKSFDSRQPIVLLGLFPCNTPTFRARGLTPAAQMAIRQISYSGNNPNLLKGYRLQLLVNNSMCSPLPAVRSYIFQIDPNNNQQAIHAIVGPGCSSAAQPVAELARFSNLIQVSYTATSPDLNNTNRFPTFFRAISSDISTVAANVATIRQFGWQQVAIITQNVNLFREVSDQLKLELARNRINVISNGLSYLNTDSAEGVINTILNSGARIVIMNVFEDAARQLFCLARQRNMIHPSFVWMSYGWYSEGWWREMKNGSSFISNTDNCTIEEMEEAIDRSLSFHHFPIPTEEERDSPTDVNYTPNEFWEEYEDVLDQLDYNEDEAISQAIYVYDAVWMIALTLNKSIDKISQRLPGQNLLNFTYNNAAMTEIFIETMSDLTFHGVSGKVVIKNRERQPNLRMEQYRLSSLGIDSVPFAALSDDGEFSFSDNMSISDIWPRDIPADIEDDFIDVAWLVFYSCLSGLGIVFALFCFIYNLGCRNKPVVKATSPYLNMLIIVGVIIIYIDAILFGIDGGVASDDVLKITCNARIWAASIGFSLMFGPMLAKAIRVYFVVTRSEKDLKQRSISSWQLILFVAILVAIDVIVLLTVTLIDATRIQLETRILQQDNGEIPQRIQICSASNDTAQTIWIVLWLLYKAALLLVGLFFAAATQDVKIRELNDSRIIAVSVYCIAAISAVLAFIGFFLTEMVDEQYAITGAFMILTVTIVLCIIFLPTIKSLFEDPSGELKQSPNSSSNYISAHKEAQPARGFTVEQTNHIQEVNQEVSTLTRELGQLKKRLTSITDTTIHSTEKTTSFANGTPDNDVSAL